MSLIIPLVSEMSEAEFESAYAKLEKIYGDGKSRDFIARRTMALAKLIAQSGWTQSRLAYWFSARRGTAARPRWADYHRRFGRFLLGSADPKSPLHEKTFRDCWHRTDQTQSEAERFAHVAILLNEQDSSPTELKRKQKPLRKQKQIAVNQVVKELTPLLKRLKHQSRQDEISISFTELRWIVWELRQHLKAWVSGDDSIIRRIEYRRSDNLPVETEDDDTVD